jgi:hypothetical protein
MNELLKALADHDRELEAPRAVERRLRAAFRKKHAPRPKWPYFALAAAALIALLFVVKPAPRLVPQAVETQIFIPPVLATAEVKPVVRKAVHRKPPPHEVVTEFYPLMEDPPPFERGELLRVSLPAVAMRGVGLPVNEDRLAETVQADVLVGQEGLARAIRFVKFER